MFPNFGFWSTSRDKTQPVSYQPYTKKSRRARASPYPTRPVSSHGYPSDDIPLRPRVPKPMYTETITGSPIGSPGPSENQKLDDSALVALEHYHSAGPAPDNLIDSSGPAENQGPDAATNPSPDVAASARPAPESLVLSPSLSENQEPHATANPTPDVAARPAPESLVLSPSENQEPHATANPTLDVAARPAPESLVLSPSLSENQEPDATNPSPDVAARSTPESLVVSLGPPENQEPDAAAKPAPDVAFDSLLSSAGAPKNQNQDLPTLPTPQLTFNSAVQNNSSQSPIPRLDIRKIEAQAKRQRGTGTKIRLAPQNSLIAEAMQEKDSMIDLLKDELISNRKDMELLRERMNQMTEQLKAKDILLERAEVQGRETEKPTEQLFQEEDVYMADNETHELRDKRGLRKARKDKYKAQQVEDEDEEMENSDTARKGKGKVQQVEDEDEVMENSNTARKAKGKVQQVEDDDEVMENSDTSGDDSEYKSNYGITSDIDSDFNFDRDVDVLEAEAGPSFRPSSVPRPYKFSKPKGGAGPKLREQPSRKPPGDKDSNAEFDDPDSGSESDNPPQPLNTIPNPLNLPHDALVALTNTVLGVIGQRDDLMASQIRRRRRIKSQKIKQPTIRASKTRRKQLGTWCRKDMNSLLDIKRDKDIVLKTPPSIEEVEAFAEEEGPGPDLMNDMRFSFDVPAMHAWNNDLAEQFVTEFMKHRKINSAEAPLVYELFTTRFSTLKRRYREWQPKRGEDNVQRKQRVEEMHKEERRMRRRDTRRNNLFADRSEIALDNRGSDERADPVWDFLYSATRLLRSEGMSSDESGQEGSGPPYYIKERDWRNRDLIPYLQMIDRDKTRINAYGNKRPGNPPRERQRIAAASNSVRKAIPDLPLNFYDKTWYAGLSHRDKTLLRPKAALRMPVLVAYN